MGWGDRDLGSKPERLRLQPLKTQKKKSASCAGLSGLDGYRVVGVGGEKAAAKTRTLTKLICEAKYTDALNPELINQTR